MCLVHTHEAADARPRRRALSHGLGALIASLAVLASAAPALAWEGSSAPASALPGAEERPAEIPPPPVRVARDRSYGSRASQKLDLYLPPGPPPAAGPGGRTAIVLVHGGAWSGFGKEAYDLPPGSPVAPRIASRLAARGFVVAAIDYTHGNIPAQVGDVRRALAWMRSSADRFGIDPAHTVAWGDSAGGQLALMAAINGWAGAAVAWGAPTDLRSIARRLPPGHLEAVVRCAMGACPGRWSALSPLSGARRLRVPVLLVNSKEDPIVQLDESALPMRAANPSHVRVKVIPAFGHAYMPEAFAPSVAFVKHLWRTRVPARDR
jgi:acetyl esterase/lipase